MLRLLRAFEVFFLRPNFGSDTHGVPLAESFACNTAAVVANKRAQEARRMVEQDLGRLRAELAGDKEAALSAFRRERDDELQVTNRDSYERAVMHR